jgi:hypothetical protein
MVQMLRFLMAGTVVMFAACGGSDRPVLNSDPALHPLLQRMLEQALRDSSELARGTFRSFAVMQMEMKQGDEGVRVEDQFDLRRDSAASYVAEQRSHRVEGDTSLLKNMYTFEDSKGTPRASERAHLASLDFGTSFPTLLRSLLAGGDEVGYQLNNKDTLVGGERCSEIEYYTDAKNGRFWIVNETLSLVRLEVRQQSNYGVGSYDYHAVIDFQRFGPMLLPVKTATHFDYRRLLTDGSGTISVDMKNIVAGSDTTAIRKQ